MTYTRNPSPSASPLTPAQIAQRGHQIAQDLHRANAELRAAMEESMQLQAALEELDRVQAKVQQAHLARKYANTMFGGPAGLAAAVAEMAEYDARKRAQKVTQC